MKRLARVNRMVSILNGATQCLTLSWRIRRVPTTQPMCILLFFFFSSRRRHTRLQGDWSSDVCSSDLPWPARHGGASEPDRRPLPDRVQHLGHLAFDVAPQRSEERRVGKECRSRWSPYH